MKFGLDTMSTLCEELGHPEQTFASVHVAGTNGKGSVTAMTATALRASGYRTARYTSPHLVRIQERFVIDEVEVDLEFLRESAARVQSLVESLVSNGRLEGLPTFFECTTAIAFELFRRADVAIAVIEVGLGGRLDATNVLAPAVTAITSIDLDHQAQLGNSLASIAREKGGIIKTGVPVVCGPLPPEAEEVVAEICAERGAPLVRAADLVKRRGLQPTGALTVDVHTPGRLLDGLTLGLHGEHQAANAAVVVGVLDALGGAGWPVADHAVVEGLTATSWPGRLELFAWRGAEVLLDAAHNPAGARALAAHLTAIGWDRVTLVFGAMQDKDVDGMLAPLAPLCGSIICTTPDTPRAMPARELARLAHDVAPNAAAIVVVEDPGAALAEATRAGTRVVVAGSIFLIGPLRDILR